MVKTTHKVIKEDPEMIKDETFNKKMYLFFVLIPYKAY